MDTLRKTFATLCAMLFIISGLVALLAFNIEWYAFDAAVYKRAFEKQDLYARTPEIIANTLLGYISENQNADPYLKELTVEDWKGSIASIVPPEELKLLTDNVLDSVFDYLNDRTDTVEISLLPIKGRLAGPAGVELVQKILRAQPACTVDELIKMGMGFLAGDIALCNPPPEMAGLVQPLIESQLQVLTLAVPDKVTLVSNIPGAPDPRTNLRQLRTLMSITPVFPLLFLFGLTVFAVRSLMDWLQWWGYPFLITGATSTLTALVGVSGLGIVVQGLLERYWVGLIPLVLLSALRETLSAVTAEILRPVFFEGIILAGIGLNMVLTSLLISYRNSRRI